MGLEHTIGNGNRNHNINENKFKKETSDKKIHKSKHNSSQFKSPKQENITDNNKDNLNINNNIKNLFLENYIQIKNNSKMSSYNSTLTNYKENEKENEFIYNMNEENDDDTKYFKEEKSIRNLYSEKLKTKEILENNHKKENHNNINNNYNCKTIFIFDWDDTLFFTSEINPTKKRTGFDFSSVKQEKSKQKIKEIENLITQILQKCLDKGEVFIITNSDEGWVETSTKLFYPNLFPILKKIKIISARNLYSKDFPNEKEKWKEKAFIDLPEKFGYNLDVLTNIICLGDDEGDINAGKMLAKEFRECCLKTIKFRENPGLKELIKQLKLIDNQIIKVYSFPKNLNIHVETKKRIKNDDGVDENSYFNNSL